MRTSKMLLSLVTVGLAAFPALAQERPPVNVGRVHVFVPKPGVGKQFEEGRKRHMDWHRKQNDPWTRHTWQVTTGEATGAYVSTSFGHTWKDFDTWDAKFAQADVADAATSMDPYTAGGATSVWLYLPQVSRPSAGGEPSKMAAALHFLVKQGAGKEFNNALRKIDEGILKTNWQPQ